MKFPEKLTKLLAVREKSQARLMRETGISQSAISEMTLGKRRPYMDQAFLLANALEVPLDYLANDEMDEPPTSLSEDERSVLDLFRALRLSRDQALRGLAMVARLPAADDIVAEDEGGVRVTGRLPKGVGARKGAAG